MKLLNVLMVHGSSIFDNIGGSEYQMRTLADFLVQNGYGVSFYFPECVSGRHDHYEINGMRVYQDFQRYPEAIAPAFSIRRLKDIVRQEQISLIYARCIRSLFFIQQVSKKTGIPFVYHIPFGLSRERFSFLSALKWIRKTKSRWLYEYLSYRAMRDVTQILCLCNEDKDFVSYYLGRSAKTIYNMQSVPPKSAAKVSPPKIIWVNNIKIWKRTEFFIDLAQRCRDIDAEFIMVGSIGNDSYHRSLRRQIDQTPNLQFLGNRPQDEVNALLAEASVYVLTSDATEGFSNGIIQGWFRGTPTITTIDKDRVITSHQIGFHISTLNEMEEKLRFLLNNPEERAAMGQRARAYAIDNHSTESQGPKYLEIFSKIAIQNSQMH